MLDIIDWPVGLEQQSQELLSGPRSVSGGAQSQTGFSQTRSSPFGLWAYSLQFNPMRDGKYRAYRGLVSSLEHDATAVKWQFFDKDRIKPNSYGVAYPNPIALGGSPWSNLQNWSNGQPWQNALPWSEVAEDAPQGSTTIKLKDVYWGHKIGFGSVFGFPIFHLAKYVIRKELAPGVFRIWPPLRKSVKAGEPATLTPTLAVKIIPGSVKFGRRTASVVEGCEFSIAEIEHADVVDFYS